MDKSCSCAMVLILSEWNLKWTSSLSYGVMQDITNKADRMDDTINKRFGFGDRVFEIVHHLESTEVVLLGPHNIVEQQGLGVPTEMAEFYEIFRAHREPCSSCCRP